MNHTRRALATLALVAAFVIAACGGRDSVASRSAAAYDDAKKKGVAIGGGHEHGGHAASATAPHDESGQMSGMDHSKMQGGQMSGMDHSKMQGDQMSGMDHSNMQSGQTPGMDHSQMQHGTATRTTLPTPASTAEVARLSPAATLTTDAFDAPAAISVAEAAKAANNVPDGEIRHVVPGQDHENPPTPQPAIRSGSGGQPGHAQHRQTPAPTAGAAGHAGHGGAAAGAPATPQAQIYTCPMHPEVTSDKPGTCPRCGMALVKTK
ncbi:MAG: heavy metal-binding domain-containing protein [Thermoanaerobaculia bacterium]